MKNKNKPFKLFKIFNVIGSSLLILMALFHGSGYVYVTEAILGSNSENFLKDIVPVLFAHPSVHLLGIAALGLLAITFINDAAKLLISLAILIFIDALLAFYLGGWLPGLLLTTASTSYLIACKFHKKAFNKN